jgi:hypothetical protein
MPHLSLLVRIGEAVCQKEDAILRAVLRDVFMGLLDKNLDPEVPLCLFFEFFLIHLLVPRSGNDSATRFQGVSMLLSST